MTAKKVTNHLNHKLSQTRINLTSIRKKKQSIFEETAKYPVHLLFSRVYLMQALNPFTGSLKLPGTSFYAANVYFAGRDFFIFHMKTNITLMPEFWITWQLSVFSVLQNKLHNSNTQGIKPGHC